MPSKEQTAISITKNNYSRSEVIHLINHITHIEADKVEIEKLKAELEEKIKGISGERKPTHLKRGDIFTSKDSNGKSRPFIIIKVLKEVVVAIPVSTCCDPLCLTPSKSRFLKDGWFSSQMITVKREVAWERWSGVYDSEKTLRKAVRALKEFANQNL